MELFPVMRVVPVVVSELLELVITARAPWVATQART